MWPRFRRGRELGAALATRLPEQSLDLGRDNSPGMSSAIFAILSAQEALCCDG